MSAHVQASMSMEPLVRKLEVFEIANRALESVPHIRDDYSREFAQKAIRGFLVIYERRVEEEEAHPEAWA